MDSRSRAYTHNLWSVTFHVSSLGELRQARWGGRLTQTCNRCHVDQQTPLTQSCGLVLVDYPHSHSPWRGWLMQFAYRRDGTCTRRGRREWVAGFPPHVTSWLLEVGVQPTCPLPQLVDNDGPSEKKQEDNPPQSSPLLAVEEIGNWKIWETHVTYRELEGNTHCMK